MVWHISFRAPALLLCKKASCKVAPVILIICLGGCQQTSEMNTEVKLDQQPAIIKPKYPNGIPILVQTVKPPEWADLSKRPTRIHAYGLMEKDYTRFQALPTVVRLAPIRMFPQEFRVLDKVHKGRLVATEPRYAEIKQLKLAAGRFFNDVESRDLLNRVVLGSKVAEHLFPFTDPLGQVVSLGKNLDKFLVVGVLASPASKTGSGRPVWDHFDDDVFMPLSTCHKWYGERVVNRKNGAFSVEQVELHQVILIVADAGQVRETAESIRKILSEGHAKKDWEVILPAEFQDRVEKDKLPKNQR